MVRIVTTENLSPFTSAFPGHVHGACCTTEKFHHARVIGRWERKAQPTLFERDNQLCVKGKCMYCTEENALCCNLNEGGSVQGAVIVYLEQTQIGEIIET
ncbi:hypothetical protein WDU94_000298 [Cyamophila willieti]